MLKSIALLNFYKKHIIINYNSIFTIHKFTNFYILSKLSSKLLQIFFYSFLSQFICPQGFIQLCLIYRKYYITYIFFYKFIPIINTLLTNLLDSYILLQCFLILSHYFVTFKNLQYSSFLFYLYIPNNACVASNVGGLSIYNCIMFFSNILN